MDLSESTSVKSWLNRGSRMFVTASTTASRIARPAIVRHVANEDLLHLYRDGLPDYKRIADLTKLTKSDLAKIADVAKSSVRFDEHIPEPVAVALREIANIANLVAEFFADEPHKVKLWFEIANPMLGNISPSDMIRIGRYKRLLSFVITARGEAATP